MNKNNRKPLTDEENRIWALEWFAARAAFVLKVTPQQLAEAAAEGTIVAKRGGVVAQYLALVKKGS